jgi:hypothetical protein
MACARLYRAQDKIVFEGSYEITPAFQADVDALRRFSPRFLVVLLSSTAYIALLSYWNSRWPGLNGLYALALGALILIQLTVHIRHFRNLFLLRRARFGGLAGQLRYSRDVILRASSLELLLFGGLYTALFVVGNGTFVLGGALACCALSFNHYRLARRHEASSLKAARQHD